MAATELYVHVPKTAGTTLRSMVINRHGSSRTYVYSMANDALFRADRLVYRPDNALHIAIRGLMPAVLMRRAIQLREALASNDKEALHLAAAVIGHFAVDKYDNVAGGDELSKRVVVREPYARMISHYFSLHGRHVASDFGGWMRGHDTDVPFTDFALSEPVQNYQTRFTGGDPSAFDVLGTTERLSLFLCAAGLIEPGSSVPVLDRSDANPAFDPAAVDQGFLRDFREFHADDYIFYEAASTAQFVG